MAQEDFAHSSGIVWLLGVPSMFRIDRITANFGAVIDGIDTAHGLSDAAAQWLHDAVVEHGVVVLRNQALSDEGQLELASRWGRLHVYPPLRLAGQQLALEWVEDTADSPPKAIRWHTDLSWEPCPPKFGLLWGDVVPDAGGDTVWADTAAAYEALSPLMQERLKPLRVVHRVEPGAMDRLAALVPYEAGEAFRREYGRGVEQPLVRRDTDNGRLSLFVAGYWMQNIVGMHQSESDVLLAFLMEHATQPRFQCRWRWSRKDLVIWDERRSMHQAMPDHYPRHRRLRRCTVEGEAPVAA